MAQKPHLTLAKIGPNGLTEEQALNLFRKLSGREPSPAEIEDMRDQRARAGNRRGRRVPQGQTKREEDPLDEKPTNGLASPTRMLDEAALAMLLIEEHEDESADHGSLKMGSRSLA